MIYCLSGDEVRSEHEKSSKNVFDKKMWFTKELKKVKRLPHDTKNGRKNNKKILLIFKYINFYFEANWRKLKRQKRDSCVMTITHSVTPINVFWTLFPSNVSLFVSGSITSLFLFLMFFYFLDQPSLLYLLSTLFVIFMILFLCWFTTSFSQSLTSMSLVSLLFNKFTILFSSYIVSVHRVIDW
jgi:membrane-associated HD superfamily phosphohydrolase